MALQKQWLEFLREQYPVGSRIKLREMKDSHHPVEPGTMGTLTSIDDIGTFHVNWDNGRTLGLVIGEDSFTVLPPETHLLKLYMPMTVDYYERNQWGDMENEPTEMSSREAVQYVDHIAAAIQRERLPEETTRGLMHYYHEDDSVNQKVQSFGFSVESRDNRLWGVAECKVIGELMPSELETLKEYISGQASDGFGEGFEQREIRTSDGNEIYAHLWQPDGWTIKTEQEQFQQKLAEGLPELCFSVLPVPIQTITTRDEPTQGQPMEDAFLEEACRQWYAFILEDNDRMDGVGFAHFYREVREQLIGDPDFMENFKALDEGAQQMEGMTLE